MSEFAHLHLHTDSSLLDGVGRVSEYAEQALLSGIRHLAITDHGVMYGAIRWFNELTEKGLHPIIGMESYLAEGSAKARGREMYHLLLLAENDIGYRNLIKLASFASLEGFYYKPRIDLEVLQQHRQGLIITSACIGGPLAKNILAGNAELARTYAGKLAEIAGPGRFYVELQDHGLAQQRESNLGLMQIANDLALPLVATNDVHYCQPADAKIQDILLCVQTGKKLADTNRMRSESDQLYLKTPEEMARLFDGLPEALSNTMAIAEMCNVDLGFKQYLLPDFAVPDGFTTDSYLEHLCRQGAMVRYGHCEHEVGARLEYELGVIRGMGFSGYFLIVWDIVRFARERGILVGPGRGSAAGSIVTYALGITGLDPLEHTLLFERFLNPDRVSMPDIDIDFADTGRQEVIEYMVQKYGADRVAQIATIGTLGARASLRDVGRVMDIPLFEIDRVAKLIPAMPVPPQKKVEIASSLERVKELKEIYDSDDQLRELIDAAKGVEGKARNASTHAAGVVISRGPLVDHVPLQRAAGKSEGEITTQYEMNDLKSTGLLKIDILGLTTLTTLGKAVELAQRKDPSLTLDTIPMDDEASYAMLRRGETAGIFQLEGGPTTRTTVDVAPERFADLTALMALIRPGPGAYVPQYRDRKRGKEQFEYLHPDLEAILKETWGVAIYQEQIMQMTNVLAGFSLSEGDQIRKAMGDKDPTGMEKLKERFLSGSIERGLSAKRAAEAWELIHGFAGYGFNKSHSAGYAVIAAQCAYLKAHYPAEFMAALLATDSGKSERLAGDIVACKREGVPVLPPDVNVSDIDFSVEVMLDGTEAVRFGLRAIKGVGEAAARAVVEARQGRARGQFASLAHFAESLDWNVLNLRTVEALAKVGALDSFGSRTDVIENLGDVMAAGQHRHRAAARGQMDLFGGDETPDAGVVAVVLRPGPKLDLRQMLEWEKEILGAYMSAHPISNYVSTGARVGAIQIAELTESDSEGPVKILAMVSSIRRLTTKTNKQMAVMNVEDLTASIEVVAFPHAYAKLDPDVQEDRVVLITGKLDRKREPVQILMDSCELLSERAEQPGEPLARRTLHLTIPQAKAVDDRVALMQRLDNLLAEFEGDVDLVIRLPIATRVAPLRSHTRRVDWSSDLAEALAMILPEDHIRFESE